MKIYFCFTLLFFSINCLKNNELCNLFSEANREENNNNEEININIIYKPQIYFGEKGYIYFQTDYNDKETGVFDVSDIDEQIQFNISIITIEDSEIHNITCKLFKPTNDNLKLICKINDISYNWHCNAYMNKQSFIYNNYIVNIMPPLLNNTFYLDKKNQLPFLYSDEQIINIEDWEQDYELKFNMEEYNDELLYLFSNDAYIHLDKCTKNENYLICTIEKEEIEEVLQYNNQKFDVYSHNEDLKLYKLNIIQNIIIIDDKINKQVVYVGITKLLKSNIYKNNFIPYETNVTNTSNIITAKFFIKTEVHKSIKCYFKKTVIDPLLLLCQWEFKEDKYLGEIKKEYKITDVSIKYIFRIQPVKNNEILNIINNLGNIGLFVYPKKLDFNLQDSYNITYIMTNINKSKDDGFRLITNFNNLQCSYSGMMIICEIKRKYFLNSESGFYYSYDKNSQKYYELSPIQIILNTNKYYITVKNDRYIGYEYRIGIKGVLFLSTSSFPSEFKGISINTIFSDTNGLNYEVNCELWSYSLMCFFKNKLKYTKQNLTFNEVEFKYGNNITNIYSEFESLTVEQVDYNMPLLYPGSKIITIKEDINDYILNLKIGSYNNDLLIISYNDFSTILDDCEVGIKTLNCKISKEKLEIFYSENRPSITAYNGYEEIDDFYLETSLTINFSPTTIKEDIYVGITNILLNEINKNRVIFQTNITSLQNINTKTFNKNCYFWKTRMNPLFIFCKSIPSNFSLEKELILDDIHYKYNFRIQPYDLNPINTIFCFGNNLISYYPEEINFEFQNSISIIFCTSFNNDKSNILIIYPEPNSYSNIPYLKCQSVAIIKKCEVSISNFIRQNYKQNEYGYFLITDKNNKISFNVALSPIKIILPEKIIAINIEKEDNSNVIKICKNRLFYIITDYSDTKANIFDASDIEMKTYFKTKLSYNWLRTLILKDINCRLWKPKNGNLIIICQLDDNANINKDLNVYFNDTAFNYNDYRVVIYSNTFFSMQTENNDCPFIYADKQYLNIIEEIEIYELNFILAEYNNELLFISSDEEIFINLDNCSIYGKNLNCKISKEKLFEYNNNNQQTFKLYYYNEIKNLQQFNLVKEIYVNYNIKKETIYVKITKLLEKNINLDNYIPYETNISSLSNIFSDEFTINNFNCYFKKSETENLLILCKISNSGRYGLGEIKEEIILDNINIKYNFRIQPGKNEEIFNVQDKGCSALYVTPQVINFYLNDILTIFIRMDFPENLPYISLNSSNLNCENIILSELSFKKCKININNFRNTQTQYYYLHHKNYLNEYIRFYELSPIKIKIAKDNEIILKITQEDNINPIKIGNNRILYFITNYYEDDNNLNNNDIENKSVFESKIIDDINNEYKVKCRLWNPKNDKIRIICNLDENLKYSTQKIMLKEISFNYDDYIINIFSDVFIEVNQYNYDISFLYSDKQNILIDNSTSIFNISFKIDSYNNDILYLYDMNNNYLLLDNCSTNSSNILTCPILVDKINEIILKEVNYFSIGAMNDDIGVYQLNNILPIEISINNYEQKIDIYLHFKESFPQFPEIGVPFGYITNITEIPNFITEKINDYCFFKKMTGLPLLLVCIIEGKQYYQINIDKYYFNNIHWKYNFVIDNNINYINDEKINISSYSSNIKFIYPQKLDFTKNNILTIRYIITDPSLINHIKLNKNSSNLYCHNLEGMKKCFISYAHFRNKVNEIYYTNYLNSYYFSEIYPALSPFEVILPKENIIEFIIDDDNNKNKKYIGEEKMLYFVTNYNDTLNIFDFNENKISFNANFSNNMNDKIIKAICNLWKPHDENIRLICKLNDKFDNIEQFVYLNEVFLNFKNYKIIIYTTAKNIIVNQLKSNISFLYSDKQIINMQNEIDSYELKFNKIYYNEEQLTLYKEGLKSLRLECSNGQNEVICKLKKEKIVQILSYSGEQFYISLTSNSEGLLSLESILAITINYNNPPQKEDIYLEITNLLSPYVEVDNFIPYETNITDINKITTNYFSIAPNKNITKCLFKKNEEKNDDKLLMLCLAFHEQDKHIGKLSEITFNDISILYNFIFIISRNYEDFDRGSRHHPIIISVYPEELDFNKQDKYILRYETENPENLNGLMFNNYSSSELKCINKIKIKECIVTQKYFNQSGYYHTYHDFYSKYWEKNLISFEVTKIKVTLKEDSEPDSSDLIYIGIIIGCTIGGLALLGIIIYLIWRYKRKAKAGNSEKKEVIMENQIELVEEFAK